MPINIDIYMMVMDRQDTLSDISALMRSCKTLLPHGAKLLLHPGVSLRSDANLVSFCRFMLRDLNYRAAYLRRLFLCIELQIIDDDGDGSVWACEDVAKEMLKGSELLRRVVWHATALEHLTIHFCEELLEREESLVDALVALKSVKYLHITSFGLRSHEVVATIHSPLVEVRVDCHTGDDVCVVLWQTLARHRDTLERVTAWGINLSATFLPLPPNTLVVFPRVHSLTICSSFGLVFAALVHAFPNIRFLEIDDVSFYHCNYGAVRDTNRAVSSSWRSLDHVCGGDIALWFLALRCPVRRIDVEWADNHLGWVPGALWNTGATHLLLQGYDTRRRASGCAILWDAPDIWEQNITITHLGVDMCLNNVHTGSPRGFLSHLVDFLMTFELTFFALRLQLLPLEEECAFARDDPRYPTAPALSPTAHMVLDDLRAASKNLPLWIKIMGDAVPSLEYVSLDILGETPSCWKILQHEERADAVLLGLEEGEAVIRAEGMVWGRRHPDPPRFDQEKLVQRGLPYEEDEWAWDEVCREGPDTIGSPPVW